ncbi:predicted protein [Streptomyces sp. SPB78]|uniref:hypothetical protein n=1 Tax=Streptomyces sp. (strain SPB78) TaxID=591157 RepID=UPI0001DED8B0|nr:hypothetical protein [Streptomyces sp. SPB78]EFK99541.1 predicted protein [Streptomyces sp. SPB78]
MANQHRHPVRGLRGIEGDLWQDFEKATTDTDSDRSAVLRAFMEWFVRRPGAKLPERPQAGPWSDPRA